MQCSFMYHVLQAREQAALEELDDAQETLRRLKGKMVVQQPVVAVPILKKRSLGTNCLAVPSHEGILHWLLALQIVDIAALCHMLSVR